MSEIVLLYTTWPDAESLDLAAAEALDQRLAACVNILGPIRSVFRWNGAITRTQEIPALFKTTQACAEALSSFLASLHPYETPAILAINVRSRGSFSPFLQWIVAETCNIEAEASDCAP